MWARGWLLMTLVVTAGCVSESASVPASAPEPSAAPMALNLTFDVVGAAMWALEIPAGQPWRIDLEKPARDEGEDAQTLLGVWNLGEGGHTVRATQMDDDGAVVRAVGQSAGVPLGTSKRIGSSYVHMSVWTEDWGGKFLVAAAAGSSLGSVPLRVWINGTPSPTYESLGPAFALEGWTAETATSVQWVGESGALGAKLVQNARASWTVANGSLVSHVIQFEGTAPSLEDHEFRTPTFSHRSATVDRFRLPEGDPGGGSLLFTPDTSGEIVIHKRVAVAPARDVVLVADLAFPPWLEAPLFVA